MSTEQPGDRMRAGGVRTLSRLEYGIGAVLGALFVVLSLEGLSRSLWLDEAWVANSVLAEDLRETLFYPRWLQSSPPLFLLASRAATAIFGASEETLRAVPWALGTIGVGATLLAALRLGAAPLAIFVWSAIVFDRSLLDYTRTFKQYSAEFSIAALMLWRLAAYWQDRRGFAWLAAVVAVAPGFSYASVFLLPGVAIGVALRSVRHALVLSGIFFLVWGALAAWIVVPNYSGALMEFWRFDPSRVPLRTAAGMGIALLAVVDALRRRDGMLLACAAPLALLTLAWAADVYPAAVRTWLFSKAGLALLGVILIERHSAGWLRKGSKVVLAASLVPGLVALLGQVQAGPAPFEDVRGAFRYLQAHVGAKDLVAIHGSAAEQFLLYRRLEGWQGPEPRFGETGWPCCARGKAVAPGTSRSELIRADLDRLVPEGFRGTVWIFYTTRPEHWKYTGLDEGDLWRRTLWERGCPPGEYRAFENLAVSPMICGGAR